MWRRRAPGGRQGTGRTTGDATPIDGCSIHNLNAMPYTASAKLSRNAMRPAALAVAIFVALAAPASGQAATAKIHNAACWGGSTDDLASPDISCTPLTEGLFLKLRRASIDDVVRAMGTIGAEIPNGLHFMSNYMRGERGKTGFANFIFANGHVSQILATVDGTNNGAKPIKFSWSEDRGGCSDFPGSGLRCSDE